MQLDAETVFELFPPFLSSASIIKNVNELIARLDESIPHGDNTSCTCFATLRDQDVDMSLLTNELIDMTEMLPTCLEVLTEVSMRHTDFSLEQDRGLKTR